MRVHVCALYSLRVYVVRVHVRTCRYMYIGVCRLSVCFCICVYTVTVDNALELLSSDLSGDGFVLLEQGTGTPFNLRIKPRSAKHRIYMHV